MAAEGLAEDETYVMKNIATLSVGALLLLTYGCAYKELKPGEVQQQVDTLCRNAANQEWREGMVATLPNVSYSDCMVEHGYIEKLSSP
ncbi:MAG: hypothetical protein NZ730_03425 [Porticoccaceae bacterium]|nr:hypothetical protein [Porticoccaceae bacterium]